MSLLPLLEEAHSAVTGCSGNLTSRREKGQKLHYISRKAWGSTEYPEPVQWDLCTPHPRQALLKEGRVQNESDREGLMGLF